MGVIVELLQDWGRYRKGFRLDMAGGAADILVNRRKLARYVNEPQTLVPVPAGLQQAATAVLDALNPPRRKGK